MTVRQRKLKEGASAEGSRPGAFRTGKEGAMPGIRDTLRRQPLWMVLAVSSGACAAFNGVFAKL